MAIVDNILGFSLKRTINNIIIDNLSEDINMMMTATVFLQQNCNNASFKQVSSEMVIEDVLTISIPKLDGTYKLRLIFTKESGDFVIKDFIFKTYKNLLKSFISDTNEILCDLNCNNCEEEESRKLLESRLVLNMMSYYILNKEYYSKIFDIGLDCIQCTILDNMNCNRVSTTFYGKKEDSAVYKKMIGYFYYVFYLGQKYTYSCCPEEIDIFFRSEEITKCLSNMNFDFKCVETRVINDDTFDVSDDNFIDLTPDAGFPVIIG